MTSQLPTARLRPFRPVQFGRYTLLAQLGSGGMGEIYLARMEGAQGFEKLCVIKKLLPALVTEGDFAERFVSEARLLGRLSHGSIAQVLDVGLHGGDPYIALEHVDGKDLRKVAARMRERHLPPPLTFVLYVMGRVLDALAYAHRKRDEDDRELNLVHRDISPQNILVSYEGEVKVIDFGLAKSTLSISKTNPSIILGKFLYMSPEQARHQGVDRRSDLYSVGLCLYELIVGKNPFDEVAPGELMTRVGDPRITPLQAVDPLCPGSVASMVMKALAVDPAERFQSAEEFRGRLLSALYEIDPQAGPETVSRFMRETFAGDYQAERRLLASIKESLKAAPPRTDDTGVHQMRDIVSPEPAEMWATPAAIRLDLLGSREEPKSSPGARSGAPRPVLATEREEKEPLPEKVAGPNDATMPRVVMPVAPGLREEPKSSPGTRTASAPRPEVPGGRREEPKSSPGMRTAPAPRWEAPGRAATPARSEPTGQREEPKNRSGRFPAASRAAPAASSEAPTEHLVETVEAPEVVPDQPSVVLGSASVNVYADTDPRVIVGHLLDEVKKEPKSAAPASSGRGSGPYPKSALPGSVAAEPKGSKPQPPPTPEESPPRARAEPAGARPATAPRRAMPTGDLGRRIGSIVAVVLVLATLAGALYFLRDLYGAGLFRSLREPQPEGPKSGPRSGSKPAPKPSEAKPVGTNRPPQEAKPTGPNPPQDAKPAATDAQREGKPQAKPEEVHAAGPGVATPEAAPEEAPVPPATASPPDDAAGNAGDGVDPTPLVRTPSPQEPSEPPISALKRNNPKKRKHADTPLEREFARLKGSYERVSDHGKNCELILLKGLCNQYEDRKRAAKSEANPSNQNELLDSLVRLRREFDQIEKKWNH